MTLDCADFLRLAGDLADADEETFDAAVRAHLDECPPCVVYLDQLRDLRALLCATAPPLSPDDPRVRRSVRTLLSQEP